MAGKGTAASHGIARDYATFYNALVPRQKTAVAPRAVVPIVDTVLLAKGKPQRWLHSTQSGEATEKVHADKESIHASFRQAGASFGLRRDDPTLLPSLSHPFLFHVFARQRSLLLAQPSATRTTSPSSCPSCAARTGPTRS
jgi:hypothetical protein